MTVAAKRTLASTPARLRWRHGTARTRLDVHITEPPQGHAPHGRVKRSRRRLPLCSVRGPAGKRRGFSPPSSSFPDFCQGIRHAADFSPGFQDHLPQNIPVKPATGRFIRYTQHIAGQPTGQDMLHTLTDQIHFHRRKTSAPVQDGIEHHGQVFVVFIEPAGVIAFLHNQAKAARLAGQQRLTGGGQRRPDTRASSATW